MRCIIKMRCSALDLGTMPHGMSAYLSRSVSIFFAFLSILFLKAKHALNYLCESSASRPCLLRFAFGLLVFFVVSVVSAVTFNNNGEVVSGTPFWTSSGPSFSSSTALSMQPPSGPPANMSQATAAVTIAGAALMAGAYSQQFPVTGQLALNLGMQIAGAGLSATMGGPVGVAFATMQLAQAGATGYQLAQALKAQNLTFPVGGVAMKAAPVDPLAPSSCSWIYGAGAYCVMPSFPTPCPSGFMAVGGSQPGVSPQLPTQQYYGNYYTCLNSSGIPPASASPVPATAADIAAAMAVIANSSGPNFAANAADMAALAVQSKMDIAAQIAATDAASAAYAAQPAVHLGSNFSVVGTQTDGTGNTTVQLQRNVLDIPPTVAGSPFPLPVVSKDSVTVVNNSVTSSTNTVSSSSSTSLIAAPTAPTPTPDFCVQHPDSLACSNDAAEGDVSLQPLPTKNLAITLTPVPVSGLAACPGPINVGGGKVFDFSGICTWLLMLKPLILAFAWLTAGAMVFRGRPYA